ncbi:MAG: LPS export ABC transporter periplasmic protein LptC [Candidatus Omnitrophota bacterium]|nr:LPS export ABC transporter periplasmic protein LptC [Candidatus Omnitrophota bacterium]
MWKKISVICVLLFVLVIMFIRSVVKEKEGMTPGAGVPEKTDESSDLEQRVLTFSIDGRSPKGARQWHLEGKSAEIVGDDIHLNDLGAVAYGDSTVVILTSDKGIFNRERGEVELMGNVKVDSDDGLTLTTEKAKWSQNTKEISTDAAVHISRDGLIALGKGGMANSDRMYAVLEKDVIVRMKPDTKVTCDGPLEIDYNGHVAVFKNNVKVEDKDGKLFSDTLTVEFDPETEKFKRVIAEGNVKTKKGLSYTISDTAIYTESTKSAKLLGRPRIIIDPQEIEQLENSKGS